MRSDLPPEVPFESEDLPDELLHESREELLADRLRGSGVGTEDPNIVGDAGPTDIRARAPTRAAGSS